MLSELSDFKRKTVSIDGNNIEVLVKQSTPNDAKTVKIIVVSKILNKGGQILISLCIDSLLKYTEGAFEVWVVDNNSPIDMLKDLIKRKDVNFVLNRNIAKEGGSYENALGLEIGKYFINPDTSYLMTVHQDTVVCKKGWLNFMLSKFTDNIKAVGVREDKARVTEGIIHVLGYIVDYQLFQNLNLSFFPDLPQLDVGDKVSVDLRKAGYSYWAAPNTIHDSIKVKPPFDTIPVDRSIDDEGDVFFMHLGRGVYKSTGAHIDEFKSIEVWEKFIRKYIL